MVADGSERNREVMLDEPSQSNGHLLESFLSKSDFQNIFRKDASDPQLGLFPADDDLLKQFLPGQKTTADSAALMGDKVQHSAKDFRNLTIYADEATKYVVVTDNKTGDVTKVVYPDGRSKEFEYDSKHRLTKIKYGDGSYYEKDVDGNWTLHSKHAQDSLGQATIRVEHDGTLIFHSADGKMTMITRPDGKIASLERDADDKVTKIDYPGNETKEFKYDQDGLSKVTNKDGSYWQRQADGTWAAYDKNDQPTGGTMGKIEIEVTGDLTMTSVDGKQETITLPNGTIYRKSNGHVTHIDKM